MTETDQQSFKSMWEAMQDAGYFRKHPHYSDHYGVEPSADELRLDQQLLALDFSQDSIAMPCPYSDELERSVKRTESAWLFRMFDLPESGTVLDLGCGFGRSTRWMADCYDSVIASDISAKVVEEARNTNRGRSNIIFCVNEAAALPSEITAASLDVGYVFTVFQHIHRDYTRELLRQIAVALKPSGKVVFNLLSNVNEDLDNGVEHTEWAIGYSQEQTNQLLEAAKLRADRIVRWYRPETQVCWLWVSAAPR